MNSIRTRVIRLLFLTHRWTGITLGLMTLGWLTSGIVVHWYHLVDPTDSEVLRAYGPPLTDAELTSNVALPSAEVAGAAVRSAVLHHLASRLVWETRLVNGLQAVINVSTLSRCDSITASEATQVAAQVVQGVPQNASAMLLGEYNEFYYSPRPLPAYRISFERPRKVDVYVDLRSGGVTAIVGVPQRLTRMFGGIPHWLDVGPLHTHRTVWVVLMVVLVTAPLISGISGLIYGIWLLMRRAPFAARTNRFEPRSIRRFIALWHNWIGIVGGAFVVTWAVSGYLMLWYPQVDPSVEELARLDGGSIEPADYHVSPESALRVASRATPLPVIALKARRFLGRPAYNAFHSDGTSDLVDGLTGALLTPLSDTLLRSIVRRYVGRDIPVLRIEYLDRHDAYYYSLHGRRRPLPVYRVDLRDDTAPSPLYIDANRGDLVGRVDARYRTFRWLGSAIHTFDFPSLFFHPTLWDVVVVILACIGALLSGSGIWLGVNYLVRSGRVGLLLKARGTRPKPN